MRSEALSLEDAEDLAGFLNQSANCKPESDDFKTLEELVNLALEWLKDEGINVKAKHVSSTPTPNKFTGKKGKKSKRKDKAEKEDKKKKPPMKTAIDVVKRIQWDRILPPDQFLVGYMDRMEGLKEKYFNAFSWEDIASVDYTVLAIPKHRIQYFKYKNEIVWDKRIRLDNVFGSTGSKITIYDIIAKEREPDNDQEPSGGNDDVRSRGSWRTNDVDDEAYQSDEYSDSYSDSDSDDDIEVTIGGAVGGLPTFMGGYDEDGNPLGEDEMDEEGGQVDKYWRDKLRPNHFLALRITNEELRDSLEEVQNQVISNEPDLADCKIPRGALHMTLTTVGLETPEKIENAATCLREVEGELSGIVPKSKSLKVKGVGNFFNRVIYAKVENIPELDELVEHLKMCLNEKGIDIRDYHEFVPHITLMKISRPVGRLTGKKYISPWLYSAFSESEFGEQAVNNIHLCAMTDDRQADGFYISVGSHVI